MTHSNKRQKSKLCFDMKNLFNLTPVQVDVFLTAAVDCMLHELMLRSCDTTKGKTNRCSIELPNIGRLIIEFNGNKISKSTIILEQEFQDAVENAVFEFKSPLIDKLSDKMAKTISNKYKSIL